MTALSIEQGEPATPPPQRTLQCYLGLAVLLLANMVLKVALAPLHFPSALVGMAFIVASLVVGRRCKPTATAKVHGFFAPAVGWVCHKWLPCFYAPALVTLPLAVRPLAAASLAKSVAVVAVGVTLTGAFTAHVAMAIRKFTGTEMQHLPHDPHPIVFTKANYWLWGGLLLVSPWVMLLAPAVVHPAATFVVLLAATMLGYLGGMAMPEAVKLVAHPIVMCAAVPNVAAALLGAFSGRGYWTVLDSYLTRGVGGMYGPGDALFLFLGVIILCFGFKVFERWDVLCRHAPEVLGATSASAAFSMLTTAALGRAAGLPTDLARGLVPRSATLALALPIAERLGAPLQLTAAAVALTGIIGGNFVQVLLNRMGFTDAITRGLTAAATAHGLGTAAMAAKEPEALPFAGLSYALCGVAASLLAMVPPFRALLLAITG